MQITIRKEYFDNIETATNSLNNFFGSGFKTKNFPMIESNEQLDASVLSILSWMNNVDPTWIDGTDKVESAIERINQFAEDHDGEEDVLTTLTNDNNTSALDLINAFIGYKMLQYINDHFEAFNELMNGIFSFELFTQTSKFQKSLDIFTKPIPLDEIIDVTGDNQYQVFNEEKYVHGIFDNSQIKLPKELKFETEITRFTERNNLENVEIVIDDSVQEAADINFFVDMHPENLRYHSGLKVVQISKQFEAKVNQLVSGLRGCNTTEDLKQYFANFPFSPDDFSHVVLPCILARVFDNPRKFPNQSFDKPALKKYTDSYKSILGKSDGAKRFGAYDIFSTFKADKEGTIKFIEDFLKLRLVNDEDGTITNNTLLVIFNIFDSRIYLDIMYNMLPTDVRTKMAPSEDAFVKKVRGKINRNAHNGNIYKKEVPIPEEDNVQTSDQVAEYVSNAFSQTDALSVSDLMYCENYHDLIHQEINTLGDVLYNHGVSVDELEEYIGESYDIFQEGLIGNLINKHVEKKSRAAAEKQISEFEERYNVKLTEEHRKLILDNPDFNKSVRNYYVEIMTYKESDKSRHYSYFDGCFNDMHRYFKNAPEGCYPIITNTFDYPKVGYQNIYSDHDGNIYGVMFNKSRKYEKIASNIKDFYENCSKKLVYDDKLCVSEYMYVDDDDNDVRVKVSVEKHDGFIHPSVAAEMESCSTSDFFGELIRDKINPSMEKTLNDIFPITKVSYSIDGKRDLYIKYKGKETSLKSLGINTNQWLAESFVQESSNVPPVDGSIPDYMKTRIKLSDEEDEKSGTPKGPIVTDIQLPPDIPSNSYDDLANSIDTRLNGTGNLDTMLGAGYNGEISKQGGEGKVVYNITNNYTNSFNKNSNNTNTNTKNTTNNNENSTITNNKSTNTSNSNNTSNVENTTKNENSGNTTTTTTNNHDSSTHNTDSNNITTRHIQNPHNNNKNNSTVLSDTKDSNKLSNGKTIQEVFAILESEEPLSNTMSAGEPPKRDILTKAMDNDKNSLAANQKIKKGLQKAGNTARATVKPISRAKQWLTNMVNSLIKRDEDKVKADMIQNPSYRSAVFKAGRIALKLGLTGAFYSINPWFGIIYAGAEGLKLADKNRLRKEVTDEFATELKILDEKIKIAREEATGYHANPDAKKRLYELMRTRDKMQQMAPQSMKSYIKSASGLY